MIDFQQMAQKIINISKTITAINKQKAQLAKSINYQINLFMQSLGNTFSNNQNLLLQPSSMYRPISDKQLTLIINIKHTQKRYITPQDICDYLHISRHNIKRNNTAHIITPESIDQFYLFLQEEQEVHNELTSAFKQNNIEIWFGEVDFFNNGYIDISSLYQFLLHYGNQNIEEYDALLIIRLIKNHSNSDKIFLQDVQQYIQGEKASIPISNQSLSLPQSHHRVSFSSVDKQYPFESRPKKYSHEFQSMESDISLISHSMIHSNHSIDINAPIQHHHNHSKLRQVSSFISQLQIQESQQSQIPYEERLINIHSRNAKYIRKLKKQMSNDIPMCTLQVQSHLKDLASRATENELIHRVRLLAEIYNKKCKEIKEFINKNNKFSFLNAFQTMDRQESNKISYDDWINYAKSNKLQTTNKRIFIFFDKLSKNGLIRFSDFLKLFKLTGCQTQYNQCQERQPLFYELWGKEMIDKFKNFIEKMMKYLEEEEVMKEDLHKRRNQLNKILEKHTYRQEFVNILGDQFSDFVRDHYVNDQLDIFS